MMLAELILLIEKHLIFMTGVNLLQIWLSIMSLVIASEEHHGFLFIMVVE